MRVCLFGDYDPAYNRTHVFVEGLRLSGVQIVECRTSKKGIQKYISLWVAHRSLRGEYDVLLIPSTDDRLLVCFATLLTSKPVVFDMLYTMYDNWIDERKLARRRGIKAWYYNLIDRIASRRAAAVLVENATHGRYFARMFDVPEHTYIRVFVGADDSHMTPQARPDSSVFEVEFHGKFFPMQGVDTIVRTAALLKDEECHFTLIGGGQMHTHAVTLARELGVEKSISFLSWVPYSELPTYIARAHVTLGLLGDFPRTFRSMPNKLFESVAMGRVCITADAPSVKELFTDGRDVVLVEPGNPEMLATKIRWLREHSGERERIERGALETYRAHATPREIGRQLYTDLERLLSLRKV